MFRIAVQTGGIEERLGLDSTYRLIRETGFDGVDANVDHLFTAPMVLKQAKIPAFFRKDADERDLLDQFRPWKEAAEKYGLENYQAHAPFPSILKSASPKDEAYNEAILEVLRRTIIGTAYIGCRNLVVHPFFYGYADKGSPEDEWELNRKNYLRLADTAKEYGVTICLENMFRTYQGKRYAATCNNPLEAVAYVDRLNDAVDGNVFGFCLDTGHALLASLDLKDFIVALGDRLTCFHVHDNNGIDDQHLGPFMGVQDWNKLVEGLAAIRFRKTMSFETFAIWNRVDPDLCPDMLKFVEKTGRYFDWKAEELAKQ